LRLCDPEGCEDLPHDRLDIKGVGKLLDAAQQHGVLGAVVANVQQLFEEDGAKQLALDANAVTALRQGLEDAQSICISELAMTLLLRARARSLLAAIREVDYPVAIVKGEDYADRLYDPTCIRCFRDIDLMVPRVFVDEMAEIMKEHGYKLIQPGGNYNLEFGERTWDSESRPLVRVEFHWDMITCPSQRRRSSLPFEELHWEQRGSAMQASPDSMLLIACVHAVISHRCDRLQHLCDIRQICRGRAGDVDVDRLRDTAVRCGVSSALAGGLGITARLLNDASSTELLRELRLPGASVAWRVLVSHVSLLEPERRSSRLRQTVIREWMKRAA
jgi:hypothetical protein